jgi:glutaredoxin
MKSNMITIYSSDYCPWCDKAKTLLNSVGLKYKEMILNKDYTKDDLRELLPENIRLTVPQVFMYNKRVGGYEDLAAYLENHNIMGIQQ